MRFGLGFGLDAGRRGFSPASLFAAGEQGGWYDPSDFSSMYQDSAGTTPVTAVGQPVGRMNDKSGRGNHATQTTAGNRPVLRQDSNGCYYLEFDGATSNRWLQTPSIDFTATDKMTLWAGVRKLSDAAAAIVCELSATSSNAGSFYVAAPVTVAANFGFQSRGTLSGAAQTSPTFASPISVVLTAAGDISGDLATLRLNRAQAASSAADQGTGNYGNYPLYIGRRGGTTLPFNGRLYGLIIRGAASSAGQIAAGEAWMNGKTRAY